MKIKKFCKFTNKIFEIFLLLKTERADLAESLINESRLKMGSFGILAVSLSITVQPGSQREYGSPLWFG